MQQTSHLASRQHVGSGRKESSSGSVSTAMELGRPARAHSLLIPHYINVHFITQTQTSVFKPVHQGFKLDSISFVTEQTRDRLRDENCVGIPLVGVYVPTGGQFKLERSNLDHLQEQLLHIIQCAKLCVKLVVLWQARWRGAAGPRDADRKSEGWRKHDRTRAKPVVFSVSDQTLFSSKVSTNEEYCGASDAARMNVGTIPTGKRLSSQLELGLFLPQGASVMHTFMCSKIIGQVAHRS